MGMRTAALVCLSVACLAATPPAASRRTSNEPFRTFALIDAKLSDLEEQQKALKDAVAAKQTSAQTSANRPSTTRPWTDAAQKSRRSARSIKLLAIRQKQRYGRSKQRFGVRAFSALAQRATAVEQSAARLSAAQDQGDAVKEDGLLDRDSLELSLQFQGIAGGYGAAHCSGRERPCCIPKEAVGDSAAVACSWKCLASASACAKGFSGPRP
jgi:hypothetical protein